MNMSNGQYIVSAKVCDTIKVKNKKKKVCDTIESLPMDRMTARKIKAAAKRRVPKAKVRIKKA